MSFNNCCEILWAKKMLIYRNFNYSETLPVLSYDQTSYIEEKKMIKKKI